MLLCRWKHDQLVAEFWLKLLLLFTKAQGKAGTVLCSFPFPNWSQYLLTTYFSEQSSYCPKCIHCIFHMTSATDLDLNTEFNCESIVRLILEGKRISISAEQVPKSQRNMACFMQSVCTGKSRANGQSSENSNNAPRMGGGNRAHVGNCLFHEQRYQRGMVDQSPISGRTAISRGKNSCCGPNPEVFLLADLSQKSKDQRAAPTSASAAPGMRGGEAHICCLNTDREHVGPSPQCTTHGSQVSAGPWMCNTAHPTPNAKQQPQADLGSLSRKVPV